MRWLKTRIAPLFLAVYLPVFGDVVNGSFEAGFVGWTTLGNASIQTAALGVTPTHGTNQALITSGSGSVFKGTIEAFLLLPLGSLSGLGNGSATEGSAI